MTEAPRSERRLSAVVVGAGFGGIAAAIRLRAAGVEDLVVLDRAPRIGGVWHHNVYPGAACDVPSPLYSYSFAQNPRWSRRYAPGPEIRDYLERIAGKWGVADRIRLDTEAHAAGWDEQTARWTVETSRGTLEADLLVAACGQLSRPQIPHLPGIERFAGRAFHSAEWDPEFDPRGRRVAVIGTGASAIQFVPAIQPQVAAMTVFQRSAAYVIPKLDRIYRAWHHALFHRSERALRAGRRSIVAISEYSTPAFTEKPGRFAPFVLWHRALLRWQVRDPELRRKLAPTDRIGCKRVLFSNDWYRSLSRPNVEVVTDAVREVTERGIVDARGVEREFDTIIYGTGFRTREFVAPMSVTGRDGVTLAEAWADVPEAYLGTTVAGFPNLFLLYGPNTNLGAGSIIAMMEAQAEHLVAAVGELERTGAASIEVRPDAQAAFNEEIHARLATSVWQSGRESWYVDEKGRDPSNWPGRVSEFERRARELDSSAYRLEPVRVPVA